MYAPVNENLTPPTGDLRFDQDQHIARVRRELIWIGCVTFLAVAVPMLLYYRRFHLGAVFYFAAGDAFYYLDVVRYSRHLPFFSFDGVHPTNGFHPLWQLLLSWLCRLRLFNVDTPQGLGHVFAFDVLLVSTGCALLSIFLVRRLRLAWLAPLALCPGFVWFAMSIADSNYLSSWSYVNGMESGLSLLSFGLLLLLLRNRQKAGWHTILQSIVLGLAVLSRLDDIFYLLVFMTYSVMQSRSLGNRLRTAACYTPAFAMIGAYMLYNHHYVGRLLPVSGAIKAGLAFTSNVRNTLTLFLPKAWEAQPLYLTYSMWGELAMRALQLWLPIILCGIFLWIGARHRLLSKHSSLACLCAGSLLKCAYNLFFVPIWNQGNWYYPIAIFTCNAVLALAIDRILSRAFAMKCRSGPGLLQLAGETALVSALIWMIFCGTVSHKVAEHFSHETADIYARGPEIAAQIRATRSKGYLEVEDGIISFATRIPSTSGIGLSIDAEALKARQQGRFFQLMDQRGIKVIVAGGLYQDAMDAALNNHDIGAVLLGVKQEELREYSIQPEPRNIETLTRIYRIVKNSR